MIKGKVASLCGVKTGGDVRQLYYRFGPPGTVELVYPSTNKVAAAPAKFFHYSRYTRPLVTFLSVEFENKGYTYTIFADDSSEGGKPQQQYGVRVRAPGKRDVVTELVCGPGTQQQLMKLEDILPHKEETP